MDGKFVLLTEGRIIGNVGEKNNIFFFLKKKKKFGEKIGRAHV